MNNVLTTLISDAKRYLNKAEESSSTESTETRLNRITRGMEIWFNSKIKKDTPPKKEREILQAKDEIQYIPFILADDNISFTDTITDTTKLPILSEDTVDFDEVEDTNRLLDNIVLKSPEEIFEDARSRWQKEKKDLVTAKQKETKALEQFYEEKHLNFKKTIGTTWG